MSFHKCPSINRHVTLYFYFVLFFFRKRIFKDLKENIQSGDYSVTGLVNKLAEKNLIHAVPVGNLPWENINTPSALDVAKKKFWNSLQGKNDGQVSIFLNLNVSIFGQPICFSMFHFPTLRNPSATLIFYF